MDEARRPRVLIPLGHGVEELEAVACIDLLRRAGCQVVTASVGGANPIVGRNRMRLLADIDIADALAEWGQDWDLVLLPGGLGGVDAIEQNDDLMGILRERLGSDRLTAAICAAPRALAKAGLDPSTPVTGHPGCSADLAGFEDVRDEAFVTAGAVVTSRGPGTAIAFALECTRLLCGDEKVAEVRAQIVA